VILTNQGNCDPQLIVDEVAAIYFAKGTRVEWRLGFYVLSATLCVNRAIMKFSIFKSRRFKSFYVWMIVGVLFYLVDCLVATFIGKSSLEKI
jgi:hypothetical protein